MSRRITGEKQFGTSGFATASTCKELFFSPCLISRMESSTLSETAADFLESTSNQKSKHNIRLS
eukprot:scaffold3359_cov123-Cylindrotheca_fusiformis.AAC.32